MAFLRNQNWPDVLELLPWTPEYKLKMVEESLHGTDISTNIPECPVSRFLSLAITDSGSVQVCLETYTRNSPIFSCVNGHFTCGTCKAQMSRKADM